MSSTIPYRSDDHRSSKQGYNNPDVLHSAGKLGAEVFEKMRLELNPDPSQEWALVAPSTSGVVVAAAIRMYVPKETNVVVVGVDRLAQQRWRLDDRRAIFVDDYLWRGHSLRSAQEVSPKIEAAIFVTTETTTISSILSNDIKRGSLHRIYDLCRRFVYRPGGDAQDF